MTEDNFNTLLAETEAAERLSAEKQGNRYSDMHMLFAHKEHAFSEENNAELAGAFRVLAFICHMAMAPESYNVPIIPSVRLQDERSVSPEDLSGDDRQLLDRIFYAIGTGLLKSRIAEISLYLDTPRRWQLVDGIIDGYLLTPLSEEKWHFDQRNHWVRALTLCRTFHKDEKLARIEESMQSYIDSHTISSPGISFNLIYFMYEYAVGRSYTERNVELILTAAKERRSNNDFYPAERFYYMAHEIYNSLKNGAESLQALFESAECLFEEAEMRGESESQGNMIASGLYERALQRYRLIPGKSRAVFFADQKIEECQKRLRRHGELSLDDMQTFSLPSVDISDIVEHSVRHVRDKKDIFTSCLFFTGFSIISVKSLDENNSEREISIADLFGAVHLSSDGRVVGRSGRNGEGPGKQDYERLRSYDFSLQVAVAGHILPSLNRLLQEYNFTLPLFKELCQHSPLIDRDRVELTARALFLGFEYRFAECIHILAPQVEYLVRTLLKKSGVRTSKVEPDGTEEEIGLGSLMQKPETYEIFDEDMHFNIRALFTESLGANLRNCVAHGLLSDGAANSTAVVYAWWLFLKIIILSLTTAPMIKIPLEH
ncbi:DUF4209 domain-containing protein [Pantoea sp. JGM49]|uniref:DUF4209 domain-containing protein n=1 Tax=Pantoea sp. JGM49 TaxID=2799791 RepID=UPI001BAC14E2|nr:DUF4209 domain-containing protein [Pantoea sp. JGM49]MBS0883210.1 DUF4209 domain-containing protein [Pantoea sp. JGM49]